MLYVQRTEEVVFIRIFASPYVPPVTITMEWVPKAVYRKKSSPKIQGDANLRSR
jgi:hypothetical protein